MKFIILMATLLFVLSSTLLAQVPPATASGPAELGKWWKNSEIVGKLQLSETQIDRIEQAFLSFRPTLTNLTTELKAREDRLRILMNADPIDDGKVLAQTESIAEARSALEKANSGMMIAIRKEITKEQWAKLDEIRWQRASGLLSAVPKAGLGQSGEKAYTTKDLTQRPKSVYQPMPAYTQAARDARIEGVVLLQVLIRKDGQVTDVKVLRGLGHGLDESAISTIATKWRFEPGLMNGQPVDVMANIEVSFRLY
jgi:TonB family protein